MKHSYLYTTPENTGNNLLIVTGRRHSTMQKIIEDEYQNAETEKELVSNLDSREDIEKVSWKPINKVGFEDE